MPRRGWVSVSLPEELVRKIDRLIEENPFFWKSRADVVIYAVRRLLEESKLVVAQHC